MKEVYGDFWAYEGRPGFKLCITTNGFVKNDGTGVMGAGVARQAADKYPTLPYLLGRSLKARGNVVSLLMPGILAFPTKYDWFEDADIDLIRESVRELARRAKQRPMDKFVVPRPGCGNGNLSWKLVRPVLIKYWGELDNIFVITKERDDAGKGKKENGTRTSGRAVRAVGTKALRKVSK